MATPLEGLTAGEVTDVLIGTVWIPIQTKPTGSFEEKTNGYAFKHDGRVYFVPTAQLEAVRS